MCVAHPSIRTRESNIVGDESPVCGLAALNCARAILCQERTDDHGMGLLARILSKQMAIVRASFLSIITQRCVDVVFQGNQLPMSPLDFKVLSGYF